MGLGWNDDKNNELQKNEGEFFKTLYGKGKRGVGRINNVIDFAYIICRFPFSIAKPEMVT